MTPTTAHPVVVVGYDGSRPSRAAIAAAIGRVAGGGKMIVVHSYAVPADYVGASYYQEMLDTALERAHAVVADLRASEPGLADVDWETDVVAGDAAHAIVRAAQLRDADEILIGSRGLGRMRALLGSVSHGVLHDATCPVTVIPERVAAPKAAVAA